MIITPFYVNNEKWYKATYENNFAYGYTHFQALSNLLGVLSLQSHE